MFYSLALVGAHNGQKTADLVQKSLSVGPVVLIEPSPLLHQQLVARYSTFHNVTIVNCAITLEDGMTDFYCFDETALETNEAALEMGSLLANHAISHDPRLAAHIQKIQVPGLCFSSLIQRLNISRLDLLMTDMEGYDVQSLLEFPFEKLRPRQIIFEGKHSDGVMKIGKNLATLIHRLDNNHYQMALVGSENFYALDTLANPNDTYLKIRY